MYANKTLTNYLTLVVNQQEKVRRLSMYFLSRIVIIK